MCSRGVPILVALLCAVALSTDAAIGSTVYHVRLNTVQLTGIPARLVNSLIAESHLANFARVSNFNSDGRRGTTTLEGGPVAGILATGLPPPWTRIEGGAFVNELVLGLDSLGAEVSFDIELSENHGATTVLPAQFAFTMVDTSGTPLLSTSDPQELRALFAIDISGAVGGELQVFHPMEFIAPDSIVLNNTTTDVQVASGGPRLRILSLVPNPGTGHVRCSFALPATGGHMIARVWDIAGRLVAVPLDEQIAGGVESLEWAGRDRQGRRVAPGVYLLQLQMADQSVVSRVVLTR